jgi:hypothetical protein
LVSIDALRGILLVTIRGRVTVWRRELLLFNRAVYSGRPSIFGAAQPRSDLENAFVWIPDSKTANGIAEVPLSDIAVRGFRDQMGLAGNSLWFVPG